MVSLKRLEAEISNINCEQLYAIFHEERGGHSQELHCGLSDHELVCRARDAAKARRNGLRRRLAHERDGRPAELSNFSRFYGGRKEMVSLIAETLLSAIDEVAAFIDSSQRNICIYKGYQSPVGDCVLEEGNWNNFYPVSAVCVVLEHSERSDCLFHVKTAYPVPSMEYNDDLSEVDKLFEELEKHFFERRKLRDLE